TASLFPGTAALGATAACVANRVDSGVASPWRLTLTYPPINASRRVVFLVEGTGKADIVRRVLRDPRDVQVLPAQGVDPSSGDLRMYLDVSAASKLGS
ncbi:MAG TPA: 6-phosphogluconolactonase, partial [Candidatus Eremiobacteraceae bacterium]|nr:6-phosphogluconolactonase [Candidatus Eremiobacteraceae bacterium]